MSKFLFYSSLLFSLFALQSFSYADYDDGDGSAEFPFEIAEPNQLIYMSEHPEDRDKCFIRIADELTSAILDGFIIKTNINHCCY